MKKATVRRVPTVKAPYQAQSGRGGAPKGVRTENVANLRREQSVGRRSGKR